MVGSYGDMSCECVVWRGTDGCGEHGRVGEDGREQDSEAEAHYCVVAERCTRCIIIRKVVVSEVRNAVSFQLKLDLRNNLKKNGPRAAQIGRDAGRLKGATSLYTVGDDDEANGTLRLRRGLLESMNTAKTRLKWSLGRSFAG